MSSARALTPLARALTPLAATLALLAGCGTNRTSGGPMDPMAELTARPTLEQTLSSYQQMQQQVFDALSAELGPFTWQRLREGHTAGCGGDFPPGSPGRTQSLPSWGFQAAIPDEQWPRAIRIIADVTARHGFGEPKVLADRPGQHDISGVDTFGGNYQFGTRSNTVWRVATGCHLPATATR